MKCLKQIVFLVLIYFLTAIPFKVMGIIPGFSDIRPVTILGPVYAIYYGLPGCLVMAAGNLVMDLISNSLRWSSIGGFAANFAGPFLIYLFSVQLAKKPFQMKRAGQILKYTGVVCLSAILEAVIITPIVAIVYPEVNAMMFAGTVLLNTAAFPVIFGIPILILLQEEFGMVPLKRHAWLSRRS